MLALALVLGLGSAALAADGDRPVEVATAEAGSLGRAVEVVGTLRSNESVVIRPEVAGRVTRILFDEGRPVQAGKALVELDSSTNEAELALARAELKLAEADAERARTLFDQKAGTARARDEAVARLASARASLALAEAQFAKTRIIAPFAGIIGLRQVSVGDVVQPGQAIVNLESIDPLKLDFAVPDLLLPRLRPGQRVTVTVDALPGRSFEGEVYAINPLIDERGRSIALRALVPNADGALMPGLFARVGLGLGSGSAGVVVPEQAVVTRNGRFFVFRVAAGTAEQVPVTLGERSDGRVEITAGIAPGETIVVAGQQRLSAKTKVEIVGPDGVPVGTRPNG
ncbi:efflux RND transporter periplasmic adaptor subunit [Zavarzinia compransoris]|nr:efflux RND transporter periplasmic adaptor subunit [Zavarzinia compransoris]